MRRPRKHFALCIDNTDYQASLIPKKIYEVIPDKDAAKDDFIRIIDESGEDYLYHKGLFVPPKIKHRLTDEQIQAVPPISESVPGFHCFSRVVTTT